MKVVPLLGPFTLAVLVSGNQVVALEEDSRYLLLASTPEMWTNVLVEAYISSTQMRGGHTDACKSNNAGCVGTAWQAERQEGTLPQV